MNQAKGKQMKKGNRKCKKCEEIKPVGSFGTSTRPSKRLGIRVYQMSTCKKCYSDAYHRRRVERGFYRTPEYRELRKRQGYNTFEYNRERRKKYPEKDKARQSVSHAVKSGKLIKQKCFCGEIKVHAHHHKGYEKKYWLDIIWLCRKHHDQAHAK